MNGLNLSNIQDAKLGSTQVSALYYGSTKIWENAPDYSSQYFTIESQAANNVISWKCNNAGYPLDISCSTDLINWNSRRSTTSGTTLATLGNGDKLYLKGSITGLGSNYYSMFSSTDNFIIYGNIMSLTSGDNFVNATTLTNNYQLHHLFHNCIYLTDAYNLVLAATTLTERCYQYFFHSCTSLVRAPKKLPAQTLQKYCYNLMFMNCSSLTTAPELPATTLAYGCYYQMFQNCSSLTTAPELPATTLETSCYFCMFQNCSSLTTAPELPATTLAPTCYLNIFASCTSLNYIKCLATNISASSCITNWLKNVAATGTFTKLSTMTSFPSGASGIPSGWTVVNV